MTNKVQCTRCGAMVLPATTVVWSLLSSCVLASLGNFTTLRVDFTCKADAEKNATWSDFGEATINTNGIGWDGPRDRYRRGWIQTVPLALDYSWQPPYSVHAAVTVSPYRFLPKDISPLETYSADEKEERTGQLFDNVYFRYSPDLKHWTTWQMMQYENQSMADLTNRGCRYTEFVRVPRVARDEYTRLLGEYATLDVPWKNDEEAGVRWILKSNPNFFDTQSPFIGYLQFRLEKDFFGQNRLQALDVLIYYDAGFFPNTPGPEGRGDPKRIRAPWSFKAENGKSSEPNQAHQAIGVPAPLTGR